MNLELFPDEILIAITNYLDYISLRYFKNSCRYFHRIYWDSTISKKRFEEKIHHMMKKQSKTPHQCIKWASYKGNSYMIDYIIDNYCIMDIDDIFIQATKGKKLAIIKKYMNPATRAKISIKTDICTSLCPRFIMSLIRLSKNSEIKEYLSSILGNIIESAYEDCEKCKITHFFY